MIRLVLAALLTATAVSAEPLVDRPLLLPAGQGQAQLAWEPDHITAGQDSVTVHSALAQLDFGVLNSWQVGAGAGVNLSPDFGFDRVAIRTLVGFTGAVALRLDVGTYRRNPGAPEYALIGGLGVSAKLALVPHRLAISVGRLVGLPPLGAMTGVALPVSDDLFVIDINHNNDVASAGLPLALTAQVSPQVAVALRGGFRVGWGGGLYSETWVPLGMDLVLSPGPVEVVASVEIPGNTRSYLNEVVGRLWVAARY